MMATALLKSKTQIAPILLLSFLMVSPAFAGIRVTDLSCEDQTNPLGIDVVHPGFSWKLESQERNQRQTAYQILVADSVDLLQQDQGNIWDSQKVESSNSIQIIFQGQPLKGRQRYYWKVRAWDQDDQVSSWSTPQHWEMAFVDAEDWQGVWIEGTEPLPEKDEDFYKTHPAPLFRKTFDSNGAIRSARLYISGLGYCEAWINGKRVGDRQLDPAWTNYAKRVFYATYDVTDLLKTENKHCLGVMLGNGWYNPLPLRMWGRRNIRDALPVGRPRMIAQLEITYADGSRQVVASNNEWKTAPGPLLRNDVYIGEIYDARKIARGWKLAGYDDGSWQAAVTSESPLPLKAASLPPIRITERIKPVSMKAQDSGAVIYDFGKNFSGWVRLDLEAKAGERVVLRYGELLNPDGTLNPMSAVCGQIKKAGAGGPGAPDIAWQQDVYIAQGGGTEQYQSRFTFHGFRYVEVTTATADLKLDSILGLRLNTDVKSAGSFSCSNELINQIQQITQRTFLGNIFSVQSDCPHREKFGYGGDIVVSCDAYIMNYDMREFYANTVRLFEGAARPDGMLTDTAPFVGIQYCGPGWAMAHPLLTKKLYRYYGNRRLVEEQYPVAKKWLDLVSKQFPDGIVKRGLSDHEGLEEKPTDAMVTPLYAQSIKLLEEMAGITGQESDVRDYRDLHQTVRKNYADQFYDHDTGKVGPGTQASQSFALFAGLLDEKTQKPQAFATLLDQIDTHDQHLRTGIFGTRYLLPVLSRNGQSEKAYQIVNQKSFPSWGYMLENGATTLWEHWAYSDGGFSHSHPMFGSVSQWFYQWLGGIQPAADSVGFDQIVIRPQVVPGLEWVRCRYDSVRGPIQSDWKYDGQTLQLEILIPANTSATVVLPVSSAKGIKESGQDIGQISQIDIVESSATTLKIGSGQYRFEVPID